MSQIIFRTVQTFTANQNPISTAILFDLYGYMASIFFLCKLNLFPVRDPAFMYKPKNVKLKDDL